MIRANGLLCSQENAGYGDSWEYRVFSQIWSEPDVAESGRRYLTIRKVWPARHHRRLPDYPVDHEISEVGEAEETITGFSIAEMELTVERMRQAFDKPALILAEWQHKVIRSTCLGEQPKAEESPAITL